eukprot:91087_1
MNLNPNFIPPLWFSAILFGPLLAVSVYHVVLVHLRPKAEISLSKRIMRHLCLVAQMAYLIYAMLPVEIPLLLFMPTRLICRFSLLMSFYLMIHNLLKTFWLIRLQSQPSWYVWFTRGSVTFILISSLIPPDELFAYFHNGGILTRPPSPYYIVFPGVVMISTAVFGAGISYLIGHHLNKHVKSSKHSVTFTGDLIRYTKKKLGFEMVCFGLSSLLMLVTGVFLVVSPPPQPLPVNVRYELALIPRFLPMQLGFFFVCVGLVNSASVLQKK